MFSFLSCDKNNVKLHQSCQSFIRLSSSQLSIIIAVSQSSELSMTVDWLGRCVLRRTVTLSDNRHHETT